MDRTRFKRFRRIATAGLLLAALVWLTTSVHWLLFGSYLITLAKVLLLLFGPAFVLGGIVGAIRRELGQRRSRAPGWGVVRSGRAGGDSDEEVPVLLGQCGRHDNADAPPVDRDPDRVGRRPVLPARGPGGPRTPDSASRRGCWAFPATPKPPDCEGRLERDVTILGVNTSHDRAACLVRNGEVVAFVAEERLDRVKHSVEADAEGNYLCVLPRKAIRYCLDAAGIGLDDVDRIVVSSSVVYHPSRPLRNMTADDLRPQLSDLADFGKVTIINHHLAHAAGAFYSSPFAEAAILVVDGGGQHRRASGRRAFSRCPRSNTRRPTWAKTAG